MAETMFQQQLPETEEVIDLKQIIRILKRRWIVIIGAPALFFAITIIYLRVAPKIYEATSIIRVQQETKPLGLNIPSLGQQSDLKTFERLVTTRLTGQEVVSILKSRDRRAIEKLVETNSTVNHAFATEQDKRIDQTTLEQLAAEAVVNLIKTKVLGADLIEIRIRHSDPELAALIANTVAEAIINRFTKEAQRDATQERQHVEKSLRTLEQQLRELEDQIAREEKRLGVVNISKEVEMLVTTIRNYELERQNAWAQRDAANAEVNEIRAKIEKEQLLIPVDVLKEDPLLRRTRDQLTALELERARLLSSFTPEHPDVQQIEERINTLRQTLSKQARQLIKEREIVSNPAYTILYQRLMTAKANKFSAEKRLQALNEFLPKLRKRLEELSENHRKIGALLRKAQAIEQVYTSLLMSLKEIRIREVTKTGNLVIADLASVPLRPVSPRPMLTLALSLVLGFMFGVVAAFLLEGLNEKVMAADEVQDRLGIHVLASIPKTRSELTHQHVLELMSSPRSITEAVRSLAANLKFLNGGKPSQVLLVTSAAPSEGKTFLSTALAIAWAQLGHQTILVDFNLRRPQVHECLGLSNDKGLSNLLVGTASLDEVLQKTPLKNLKAITSGPLPPNPAELLDSEQIDQILNDLRERADIVVLDTPPILTVSDTLLLVPYSDGVIAVVVLGQTLKPMLKKLKEQVAIAQGRLIGAVINKVTTAHEGYYRYYYRYYSRYYGEAE
ncbi:MAG: polysaccharide biosynthesis tyrosine autokinase [Armatimonadetes bacterium]|nr:polysaccharide biosynthesis tyrosine autokinase [Armatimonadota bacterium]